MQVFYFTLINTAETKTVDTWGKMGEDFDLKKSLTDLSE